MIAMDGLLFSPGDFECVTYSAVEKEVKITCVFVVIVVMVCFANAGVLAVVVESEEERIKPSYDLFGIVDGS